MNNTVHLNALTEAYLKSLIADSCSVDIASLDVSMPFTEMGIDSFYVLKLVKQLEQGFGNLPKTLLFEYFNVQDLAGYFVEHHSDKLQQILGQSEVKPNDEPAAEQLIEPAPIKATATASQSDSAQRPILALEQDALATEGLGDKLRALFEQFKNEGSVSRGTRNIAQNLFIGSRQLGFFNYGRCQNILLAYAYTGPEDYFDEVAGELLAHCLANDLELNILTDVELSPINGQAFTSTPFGVVQRVLDIDKFTTGGSSMRRLRYQVSKFEKAGKGSTVEYQCGTDKQTDIAIADVIDQWCNERTMVNPLIYIVKDEILNGRLDPQHRLFLTYLGETLQNVILISKMVSEASGHNGYLMDLEFYGSKMPLGGLEFGIVNIIDCLAKEGCNLLSMGGTYGCKLDDASAEQADPELDKVLGDLREQNVFNDAGNMQFKNKFRPQNKTIYLCRAKGYSNPHNVIDIIMMIADPERQQQSDEVFHNLSNKAQIQSQSSVIPAKKTSVLPEVSIKSNSDTQPDLPRAKLLAEHGYNPLNIDIEHIEFDGKTDSWAQLKLPAIERQMQQLHGQINQATKLDEQLKTIFGFDHFVLTQSGRTAERIFYDGFAAKGKVLTNLMFPTAIFSQIDKGFNPVEVPTQSVFDLQDNEIFKGNLDIAAVESNLEDTTMVCVELINNAAGGAPVSMNHLIALKALLDGKSIPLVLDITRIIENALFIQAHETEYQDQSVWQIVKQICAQADFLTCSLAKDFCIAFGGFVATNDAALSEKLQSLNSQAGTALDVLDKKLLGHALAGQKYIERQVRKRKDAVAALHQSLTVAGLPLMHPAGGHGVVFDPKALAPFSDFADPAASFVAWLYLNTGIRAGIHSVGMQKDTCLNQTVRLAVAVGNKPEHVEALAAKIVAAFENLENIPALCQHGDDAQTYGDIHAQYQLENYHNVSTSTKPVTVKPVVTQASSKPLQQKDQVSDIAIVGMAGRYPKAKDRDEFWQNLIAGRDCVDEISEARMALRRENAYTRSYRGGFVEEVDRFDSLFFNISPREAEILDPQERLFLEVAYEAIEDAGYYPQNLVADDESRDIGVFVGAVWAMYQMVGTEAKLYGKDLNPNSFLWSVANRVSYWMNLSGPSLTVDTACSSSLTALYMACEAIKNGECRGALVGGVNLDLHQQKFDINWSGGALSPDGLCRTFGDGANGYVAGEGVGALYLKGLEQALKDKDTVQGVIKSVVVNHGGRTSGYTVPNPRSQAALVTKALDKAGVDPKTIGYIEAHGTGTELGDPIEIRGLSSAFEPAGVAAQSCAIGSVKTNIGHLEAAAGVVGVAKVLLQMKHQTLAPSLHSNTLNEHIDFAASPFVVQQQVADWASKTIDGISYPLRAGVSSFGAGGANAHVLIEQYHAHATQTQSKAKAKADGLLCFPLSARNEQQLKAFAEKLKAFVEKDTLEDIDNIAFTLQVGKNSFEHRLAVLADSKQELAEKLGRFIEGQTDELILQGNSKNAQSLTRVLSQDEKAQFIAMLSSQNDPLKLAKLWIDGMLSDWQGMIDTAAAHLRRVPLPTYPFADKRHWSTSQGDGQLSQGTQVALHPLIDCNESTFERQLFKKTFRLSDFVIGEHVVTGIATLPGVAYLELARKAGELAAGRSVSKITDVMWLSPLTVENDSENETYIDLQPAPNGVQFEVFSQLETGKKVYATGRLHYLATQSAESLDIAAIKSRCQLTVESDAAYPQFKSLGLEYGPSFQGVESVYRGNGEVLGQLQLPKARVNDFDQYQLHPALIDCAMQAGVAAQLGDTSGKMMVPYSLGEVEIYAPLTERCYSYITKADDSQGKVSRENITIADENGQVLLKITNSVGVPIGQVHEKSDNKADELEQMQFDKLYYHHQWHNESLTPSTQTPSAIVLFDHDEALRDSYRELLKAAGKPSAQVVLVKPGETFASIDESTYSLNTASAADFDKLFNALNANSQSSNKILYRLGNVGHTEQLDQALEAGVYGMLYLCQTLINHKLLNQTQVIYNFDSNQGKVQPYNDAVNGFVKSLLLENSKANCKVVEVRGALTSYWSAILSEYEASDTSVRYQNGQRTVRQLARFDLPAYSNNSLSFKHKGVYLVTGGAGGLGLIFAKYLAAQCQARLVLTGRSELNDARQQQIDALKDLGAQVLYVATDVSDKVQVEGLLEDIRSQFGGIDGIVHSAGVLRDSFLRNKTFEEMAAVFAPKVFGTEYLDQLSANDELDFFVTFSSLAALGGNAGQCDYAYANHYMDSFAQARNELVGENKRHGTTVSLNWSLWAEGGMQLDEQTEIIFKRSLGIKPLSTEVGVTSFAAALQLSESHLAVVEAAPEKLEVAWGLREPEITEVEEVLEVESAGGAGADVKQQVQDKLIDITIDFLKLDREDIDIDTILMDLGFDSIGLASFANAVNDVYHTELTPVLFFEYPNIRDVTKHIVTAHSAAANQVHQSGGTPAAKAKVVEAKVTNTAAAPVSKASTINKGVKVQAAVTAESGEGGLNMQRRFVEQPIAIVGMSGVMPQSDNLDDFWQALHDGKDLVTEIPRDRWQWEDVDGDPIKEKNKSYSRWGGFMREVDKFDPLFFRITPKEAEMMDPQQRLLVECVYQAIENSGTAVGDLAGTRTGLFVGVSAKDYVDVMAEHQMALDGYSASGTSHSILANRISFLFDLRGPSAPIDTACSSSLIALHRAIESIHTGSSDMAIIGGVQVILTPAAHIALSSAGMLSADGKCKTFDESANGYVRGEGCGAIFIKPLAQAELDGNPIHGVVKATAENHGGKVSALTVPNPNAQYELLVEAYEKAEIDPAHIGLIECHGTGTSLGDPIEIQALTRAFKHLYDNQQLTPPVEPHCALTAVKTNIGHLEPVAGMAGLLKLLLSIKNKAIPGLVHFDTVNPYIELDNTGLFIADKTRPWQAPRGTFGETMPRLGGVSSFGWGGANAHVVVAEYTEQTNASVELDGPQMIVLSARNKERLHAYAQSLLNHLQQTQQQNSVDLHQLAYTLQVGRDAMEHRLGFVADSVDTVISQLNAYVQGHDDNVYQGIVDKNLSEDSAIAAQSNDHDNLLSAWCQGRQVDWSAMYLGNTPNRVCLPTYPFERTRYWVDPSEGGVGVGGQTAVLHPLLHRNSSVLGRTCFDSQFSGREFFLSEHRVMGDAVMPSMAMLEMARVAAGHGLPHIGEQPLLISNIDFAGVVQSPNTGKWVTELNAKSNDSVNFALRFEHGEQIQNGATGSVGVLPEQAEKVLDVEHIKALMAGEIVSGDTLYEQFDQANVAYGESFKVLQNQYQGQAQQLLELQLPEVLGRGVGDYVLHPAMLDGVLQGCATLLSEQQNLNAVDAFPRSIEQLKVINSCTSKMYAWIRYARGAQSSDPEHVLDIDLLDSDGKVCMTIKGLHLGNRAFEQQKAAQQKARDEAFDSLLQQALETTEQTPTTSDSDPNNNNEFEKILAKIF